MGAETLELLVDGLGLGLTRRRDMYVDCRLSRRPSANGMSQAAGRRRTAEEFASGVQTGPIPEWRADLVSTRP